MASTVIGPKKLHEESDDFILGRLKYVPMFAQNMERGAGDLVCNLEQIIEHELWRVMGCESMDEYAFKHLNGHTEVWCREVIRVFNEEWDRKRQKTGTVGEVSEAAEKALSELAKDVPVLNPNGTNQHSLGCDKKENVTPKERGNSKEYRIAKLKRDYPEIAERLINGEFKTVAAAERAAGIGKPKMTAVEKVVKAFDRLSDEEKAEFMAMAKARQVDEKETNQKILEKIRKSGVEPYIDPKTLELFIEPDTLSEKQRAYIETHKDFIIKELCIERISQDRQFIRELYKELRNSEPVCVSKPIFSNGQLKKIRMLAHPDKHNNSSLSNEVFKMVDTALKG